MTVPTLTLTLLGASGSGKTAYLHGMYNRLSSGVQGYYLYTTDPDLDLDLAEDWARLRRTGTMPKATSEEPISYEFVFRRGMRDLMTIDCVDFRGNAALDRRGAAADVAQLEERLMRSDSIILALDSEHVAEWIKHGAPGNLDRDDDPMEISRFSRAISRVFSSRLAEGDPVPGVTVLLTKADLLAERTGLRAAEALQMAGRNFPNLVPVLAGDDAEGVTVALCAVQLGNFGAAAQATVDASRIAPKNLHLPIIFSLRHYLSEGIVRNRQEMDRLAGGLDASRGELAALSQGLFGGFFKGAQKTSARQEIDRLLASSSATSADLARAQERCQELDAELRGVAIYRDGRLLTD
ncbi:hypothetical protein ACFVFS_33790 [Kitasatospora sp. NPDC057692]|uniref:hypothetical protein n=1 Tax=Kitasatospora sp. NPDC057692 TaxID=3346215 RepID=UPI0036BDD339